MISNYKYESDKSAIITSENQSSTMNTIKKRTSKASRALVKESRFRRVASKGMSRTILRFQMGIRASAAITSGVVSRTRTGLT